MTSGIYDLIVIGAGPAGISAMVEASELGMTRTLLLEKTAEHSSTIRQYYKEHKRVDKDWMGQKCEILGRLPFVETTKEGYLELIDGMFAKYSFDTVFGEEIERIESQDDLLLIHSAAGHHYKAKYCIIAIGNMGKPKKPTLEIAPQLKSKINFDVNSCKGGESVLVVGGGNSAIEYACDLSENNDTALSYRQEHFTRLNAQNLLHINRAFAHGSVRALLGTNIVSVEEAGEKVRVNFAEIAHEEFDRVVFAIGGSTPKEFIKKCKINMDGAYPTIDIHTHETNIPNLYIIGDLAQKTGGSIGIAINHAVTVVVSIEKKL
jgi:thioredoxin reductase (NADPH)